MTRLSNKTYLIDELKKVTEHLDQAGQQAEEASVLLREALTKRKNAAKETDQLEEVTSYKTLEQTLENVIVDYHNIYSRRANLLDIIELLENK